MRRKTQSQSSIPAQSADIVIVGANFAGLECARQLSDRHRVTVFDPNPHIEFLPNIHELLSGVKSPPDLRLSKRRLVETSGHQFVQTRVAAIDLHSGNIETIRGRRVTYDICVVAVGGVNHTHGVSGVEQFARPFKSVNDCQGIGRRLQQLFSHKSKPRLVIVGGGLEGIEALGEILRRYRKHSGYRIDLIESDERLLPDAPFSVGREVRKASEPYAVHFHTGKRVAKVLKKSVILDSGQQLRSDLTIWTGGALPSPLLADCGLSPSPDQWAPVRNTLQSCRSRRVFVIGDAAQLPAPIGKQAYHAMDMAATAAGNITNLLADRPLEDFKPSAKPTLLSFGDLSTFIVFEHAALAGTSLAAAKEGVYQATMAAWDARAGLASLKGVYRRAGRSLEHLAWPTITSLQALMRLKRVRLLL